MQLVERDGHFTQLDKHVSEFVSGAGRLILLHGPVGTGKTALLQYCVDRAAAAGALVLSAVGSAAEESLPFGVLGQLLRGSPLPAEVVARLCPAARAADQTAPDEAETLRLYHRLCVALLDLAGQRPLVVTVDDLQHTDDASMQFVVHLARRVHTAPVLVVVTDDLDQRPDRWSLRSTLRRQPNVHATGVGPLSPGGVAELIRRNLGEPAARRLATGLTTFSGGNPALLEALVEDHRCGGDVRVQGYGRTLLVCLHRSDPEVLQVARGLAVLGDDAEPSGLSQLTGLDFDAVGHALHTMVTARFLVDNGFRHPAGRTAVLDDLSADEHTSLHLRAARQLHDLGHAVPVVARLLVDADRVEEPWSISVLLAAAEHALVGDDPHTATRCLELAHRESHEPGERLTILARLTQAQWSLNPLAVTRHLATLAAPANAARLSRQDRTATVRQLLWHGRTTEAVSVLEGLRETNAGTAPEAAAELADTELWLAHLHPPLARRGAPAASLNARRPVPVTTRTDPWLRAVATMSELLGRGQFGKAADHAQTVLRDLRLRRGTAWTEEAALLALRTLVSVDQWDVAGDWCTRLRGDCDESTAPTWRAIFAVAATGLAFRQGDMPAAHELAEEAMTVLSPRAWGVAASLPVALATRAATRMGRFDEATRYLALLVPETLFETTYGLDYLHARGDYYLATNHPHAALSDFLACGELIQTWDLALAAPVLWRTSAAEAWLRLGNHDQAGRLIYDQLARPEASNPRVRGTALRLLALISPLARRPAILTEAMELFEACGDRYEMARVLATLSRTLHTTNNRRRARTVFRRAWHVAKMCGATPICNELLAIDGDLGALDGVSSSSDSVEALTDSERRVASLAVMGYTNREIAMKLFITASTVEQHLTRVYRKLGVRQRKELPANLSVEAASTRRRRLSS
uniref:LAL family regulator n=1 Tax=Verrucosispora sp. TaxID=1871626 RepID=A0A894JSW0_9ACTN|nr:LAL family regulator [Verrucosispora sp.]